MADTTAAITTRGVDPAWVAPVYQVSGHETSHQAREASQHGLP
jgi:hypothetical protein